MLYDTWRKWESNMGDLLVLRDSDELSLVLVIPQLAASLHGSTKMSPALRLPKQLSSPGEPFHD